MADRTTAVSRLIELLQADEESIPYVLGYLSPHLPTECMEAAVQSYERHLVALSAVMAVRELADANAEIAQE